MLQDKELNSVHVWFKDISSISFLGVDQSRRWCVLWIKFKSGKTKILYYKRRAEIASYCITGIDIETNAKMTFRLSKIKKLTFLH
jgi:hypothetical protein